ncbi:TPA: hypothetical protein VHH62_001568 [Streptococcus pyogenes]|uniref:Uncharacterized protein n=2 Tax=Streptococcus TaxID=1301 RepID=A0AAE9QZE1_STREQ|nr:MULTISPECIES: hypothetical protein [Streptococcus]AEQ24031.1 hypothetical protein SPYALAB49_000423 [Streptococcus pyogenes Alab49]EPZ46171.1 hypothetical protein HMPREF1229_1413 [Streptococcus pyogenes GA40634]ERL23193.1 hypothetical protein HMPREF1231_0734 [Streptococcus pyogenes GA06023]ESU87623.1 hypothetical protein HMPREF1241_0433 [Streptococcus pyogenes GA03799]ESU91448.1 hypothetical protein HMPREF1240_0580 [Streptococcus pyogenes GA03455]KGE57085.1 hypothetical protein SPYAA216_041
MGRLVGGNNHGYQKFFAWFSYWFTLPNFRQYIIEYPEKLEKPIEDTKMGLYSVYIGDL